MSYTKVVGWGPFRLPGERARRKAIEDAVAAVPRQEPAAADTPPEPEPQPAPASGPKHAAAPEEEQDTAAPRPSNLILDTSLNWHISESSAELTLPEHSRSLLAIVPEPDLFVGGFGVNPSQTDLTEERSQVVEYLSNVASSHLIEVAKLIDKAQISESQLQTIQSIAYEYEASNSLRLKLLWADKLRDAARNPGTHSPLYEASNKLWETLKDVERALHPVKPSSRLGRMPDLYFHAVPGKPALANGNIESMQLNLQHQLSELQKDFSTFATGAGPDLKPADVTEIVMILERLRLGSVHDMLEAIVDLRDSLDKRKRISWTARNMDAHAETIHHQLRLLEALIGKNEARVTHDTPVKPDDDAETNDPSGTGAGGRR